MAVKSLIFVSIYIYIGFSMFRQPGPELTPEERDARTVFCMQLSARIRPRDLEEFFSSVGKVCECYNNLKCVKYINTKIKIKNHTNKLRIHIVIKLYFVSGQRCETNHGQ